MDVVSVGDIVDVRVIKIDLEKGKVVERGTHDQLFELNGYYRRLIEMQQSN